MTLLIQDRPVLEQLAEAVKWWNADEAEEPDVRRLFAACKAEIERLRAQLRDEEDAWGDLNGQELDAVSGEWLRGFAAQRIDAIRKALEFSSTRKETP